MSTFAYQELLAYGHHDDTPYKQLTTDFVGKFEQKLDNTLGLMISIDGFTEAASSKATSGGRLLAVFMDGRDIIAVLDGLLDIRQLLARKLRHAAEKGDPMYRIGS